MTPEELYDKLRPLQEAKGFYFNKDKAFVLDLMESLLVNRERYGYMACPLQAGHPATANWTRTSSAPACIASPM